MQQDQLPWSPVEVKRLCFEKLFCILTAALRLLNTRPNLALEISHSTFLLTSLGLIYKNGLFNKNISVLANHQDMLGLFYTAYLIMF